MRVLFSCNLHLVTFPNIKLSRNYEITLPFTDVGKLRSNHNIFYIANLSFYAIRQKFRIYSILPSMSSTLRSSTNDSHHFCFVPGILPDQSVISNLFSLVPRYINETAMISGSHCRDSVVHKLKLNEKNHFVSY